MLGVPGARVRETADEVVVVVETTADLVGCERCGTRATAHDWMRVDVRDLPCFGRPARLVWHKRRWRCREALCDART
jgi:transposase